MKAMHGLDGIVGNSPIMQELYWKVHVAAENDVTVLITGESGTGKDLVARSIHTRGRRPPETFFALNLGAMARELVQSELFGHERGAFTGATVQKAGLFELASGGTVFLDEIGSADYSMQTALLRVLENRQFRRVGGTRTFTTDTRVIAATNQDLKKLIAGGQFREDLYYRLEVFTIDLPPLRSRPGDIPLLVENFVRLFNETMGLQIHAIDDEVLQHMVSYTWPGNVRELRNVLQSCMILSENGRITVDQLPPRVLGAERPNGVFSVDSGISLRELEKRYIRDTLRNVRGNKSQAARSLGVSRRYLYNKIHEYNIRP